MDMNTFLSIPNSILKFVLPQAATLQLKNLADWINTES